MTALPRRPFLSTGKKKNDRPAGNTVFFLLELKSNVGVMATTSMLPQKHGGGEQAQFLPQVAAGSGQEALSEFAGSRDLGQHRCASCV